MKPLSLVTLLAATALLVSGCSADDGQGSASQGDDKQQRSATEVRLTTPIMEITPNPHADVPGMQFFTKHVDVFGVGVYAESGLSDAQVLHAAAVLAELLDNDEDGVADDEAVVIRLNYMMAIMPMFDSQNSDAEKDLEAHYEDFHRSGTFSIGAVLYAEEVDPDRPGHWGSDASVEEIMHTINQIGHAFVYPNVFGHEPSSSLLSDAMDLSRGGQFESSPGTYPEKAWYHYGDSTCSYECMVTEYIYWAQVSNMGILDDPETCDGIANEWEPCSRELLRTMDPSVYELITNPKYKLPQNAPDGKYTPEITTP